MISFVETLAQWGFFEKKCELCLSSLPLPVFALEIGKPSLALQKVHFFRNPQEKPEEDLPDSPEKFLNFLHPQ
ncbi:MAG: hypothetical protein DSZ24_02510, partial [Thermodesulfatator sp.]